MTALAAPPGRGPRGDGVLMSAAALAARLGQRHPPTPEQARAIEHLGPDGDPGPFLVVAGAGSGKTETMAARVVWLVANRLVRPERVLGLTFTRKAAGELGERVRQRLRQLERAGLLAHDPDDDVLVGEPTVSTYHAYAGRLFAEHAPRLGLEPSARLLGEAACWQYAGRVVHGYAGDLLHVDWGPPTVIGALRSLSADLAEHLVDPRELGAFLERTLARVEAVPPRPKQGTKGPHHEQTRKLLATLRAQVQLLPLAEAYDARKRDTDAIDHGDQVALAARVARRHPVVGAAERARYDVVLLDEYQDTGHAQRSLLTALFGQGHAVTAVGDPCQSIYGWRGASVGNLRSFPTDFAGAGGGPADQVDLTVSFRNPAGVLAVANALSGPLRASGVPVADLRPTPGAPVGEVVYALHRDAAAEAEWIAERVAGLVRGPDGAPGRHAPGEVAVLARKRSLFPRIEAALRAAGVPVEVSGLGGLLSTPEVSDVVATLRVITDPSAGDALVRLLTGARWRLGPRDLDALGRRGAELTRAAAPLPPAGTGAAAPPAAGPSAARPEHEARSLVEALDDLGPAGAYSPAGHARLVRLGEELRALRGRTAQPLPELVADIVRTTHLDAELAARPGEHPAAARGHLDRFLDVAGDFAAAEEDDGVPAFLAYLEAAEEHERGLDTGRAGVPGDAVQLMTVHAAKGLEWPVVVVPGLVEGVFPGSPQLSTDWSRNPRVLPFPLRGDAADLPALALAGCADQVEVRDALQAHAEACAARDDLEERRLAYVAITRAQSVLVCSGYHWDSGVKPRPVSRFLAEVRDAAGPGGQAVWEPEPRPGEANPLGGDPPRHSWPSDPLAPGRRVGLDAGAALVREAAAALAAGAAHAVVPGPSADALAALSDEQRGWLATWDQEVGQLLAERERHRRARDEVQVALPGQVSVSQLVALRRDPAELARRLRRPVPLAPAPLARRGTAFHLWLEQRFEGGRLLDLEELPGSADAGAAPDEHLDALRERFLASPWAERQPVEGGVEVPFQTEIGGVLVRGRMDAVFGGPDGRYEVVDWKTGSRPVGADADAGDVQLAAYRLAWHRLTGVPLAQVGAAFHYVRSNETVRPVDLLGEDELAALVTGVPLLDP